MDQKRLTDIAAGRKLIAYDVETDLVQPGLNAPPIVCASTYAGDKPRLHIGNEAAEVFLDILETDFVICGANISYDVLCVVAHYQRRGMDILPQVFAAYKKGRFLDTNVGMFLHELHDGRISDKILKDKHGAQLCHPISGKQIHRYSLEISTWLLMNRVNAKQNDRFRLSYALLRDLPLEEWPKDAREYPLDDAVNSFDCAVALAKAGKNAHQLAFQSYSAFCLSLGAMWGVLSNPEDTAKLKADTLAKRDAEEPKYISQGLLKFDEKDQKWKTDRKALKTLIAITYGATGKCEICEGTGKVISENTGKLINCKACDSTGIDLDSSPNVPRTPKGGVTMGRDCLYESGEDLLMEFAEFSRTDKILSTYMDFLERGQGKDGEQIPIVFRPNPIIATGRNSYMGVIQLLPREGGVRDCLEARPGKVFISNDYGGIELCTHGQSCIWIVGQSNLADMINNGVSVHDLVAAEFISHAYEDFLKQRKAGNKVFKDLRQAAKPVDFGYPGGMGAATLVLQQRAQGPDTTAPGGVKYKGLRFCILSGKVERCGVRKVTKWGQRSGMPPTCEKCLEIAEELRVIWFRLFPENRKYFKWVSDTLDAGEPVIQHISKRVRAGVTFTSKANSPFQGLASDGMKLATQRVAEESYTNKNSVLYGWRTILVAHDELFGEAPEHLGHEQAMRLSEIMEGAMSEFVPDVKITTEAALMRRYYKAAEPVFDGSGRMKVWEPE